MNFIKGNISLLQSSCWETFQREVLHRDTSRISVEKLEGFLFASSVGFGQYYAYAPYGPFGIYSDHALKLFIEEVRNCRDMHHPFFLRIEPFIEQPEDISKMLQKNGFRRVSSVQPEETMIINLERSEDELLQNMEHDTRYSIRVAERRGVKVHSFQQSEISDEIFDQFWNLFLMTNQKHALKRYNQNYYRGLFSLNGGCTSRLYLAFVEDHPIAAAIIVFFGTRATYLYAASAPGFGKYNAPTALLWRTIRDAKAWGFKVFDFWGVSSNNAKWVGVTAFKKSFGGTLVRYQGTWDYIYNHATYRLYMAAKKLL